MNKVDLRSDKFYQSGGAIVFVYDQNLRYKALVIDEIGTTCRVGYCSESCLH